jgi:hypothetical protein
MTTTGGGISSGKTLKMSNKNYQAGRRLEWERKKHWEKQGYKVVRSAGSHGIWDLCAVKSGDYPVTLIQCKVVETDSAAKLLLKKFKDNPPLFPSRFYHLALEVKVKGKTDIQRVIT